MYSNLLHTRSANHETVDLLIGFYLFDCSHSGMVQGPVV